MTRKRWESFCMVMLGMYATHAAWYVESHSYWLAIALGLIGSILVWTGWAWNGGVVSEESRCDPIASQEGDQP